MQQRAGRVHNPLSSLAIVQNPALEREAERMGLKALVATPPPALLRACAGRCSSSSCGGRCQDRCGGRCGGGKGAVQPMMSSNTKTDPLGRMTRTTYNTKETALKRQGLSLENVTDSRRITHKPKEYGVTCLGYPHQSTRVVWGQQILGQQITIPYDWNHLYACFEQWSIDEVVITYSGGRMNDFNRANTGGGYAFTPANYTWHHVEDYNPLTNRGTMQLVLSDVHNSFNHRGGVWVWANTRPPGAPNVYGP